MPFIRRGKLVEVVTVASEPAKSDEIPGADMAHHLARHGAKVELERITLGGGTRGILASMTIPTLLSHRF
jgi:hypothetical protein